MKASIILLLLFAQLSVAQNSLNQYQVVMVPSQFKFQTDPDQYRLNTLTKMLLEKYGFKAYLDSETLPDELIETNCNKLYADVISSGNFIRTKLQVVLSDCKKNVLYQSAIGTSKEKEYRVAYTQALRSAFQSFDQLSYHYNPESAEQVNNVNSAISEERKTQEINNESGQPVYYAQAIPDGFQLVDITPKVVMKIYKTSKSDTYVAVKGDIQGILLLRENQWYFEHYESEKLVSEKVNVKF